MNKYGVVNRWIASGCCRVLIDSFGCQSGVGARLNKVVSYEKASHNVMTKLAVTLRLN